MNKLINNLVLSNEQIGKATNQLGFAIQHRTGCLPDESFADACFYMDEIEPIIRNGIMLQSYDYRKILNILEQIFERTMSPDSGIEELEPYLHQTKTSDNL